MRDSTLGCSVHHTIQRTASSPLGQFTITHGVLRGQSLPKDTTVTNAVWLSDHLCNHASRFRAYAGILRVMIAHLTINHVLSGFPLWLSLS